MANTVLISCPTCGGKGTPSGPDDPFTCDYCGNHFQIARSAGSLSFISASDDVLKLKQTVDSTHQIITRSLLQKEIQELQAFISQYQPEWSTLKAKYTNNYNKKKSYFSLILFLVALGLFLIGVISQVDTILAFSTLFCSVPVIFFFLSIPHRTRTARELQRYNELAPWLTKAEDDLARRTNDLNELTGTTGGPTQAPLPYDFSNPRRGK